MATERFGRSQAAFPSPLVILSVIAVAMAGIAYVATNDARPQERQIETVARPEASPSQDVVTPSAPAKKKTAPAVQRGKVYVEVYNNSGITGLAGDVAAKAGDAGWQVVGSDNWVGTIPDTTVYYPTRLKQAAKLLALDLGIRRVQPAVDPMKLDRLTVILTG